MRRLYPLSFIIIILLISGCAGPKVAIDLLEKVEKVNDTYLIKNSVTIDAGVNPSINNSERIDKSVIKSLRFALNKANIFGDDSAHPYWININVTIASQSRVNFGSFNGKLEIHYTLFDDDNNKIIDKTIYTEAGSDIRYFSGAKRHRRARAANIAKNVLEFVSVLQARFK